MERGRSARAWALAAVALGLAPVALGFGDRPPNASRPGAGGGGLVTTADTRLTHGLRRPNHLAGEKSPYLLQHALNPVDWYPWGTEAFEKARRENKPIFLSIGYSTCHWCHVMERESFEDDSVAALLNESFVAIKVDREERPDVDHVYMTAMQALGVGGGWPLNVFLTPDRKPFFGGTYFPRRSMPGRIGLLELLPRVQAAWHDQRDALEQQGSSVLQALDSIAAREVDSARVSPGVGERLAEACAAALDSAADPVHGGFGDAPKFPQAVNLSFLFRHYARMPAKRQRLLEIALSQLDAMRAGGIHDALGGGFHRYTTDGAWLVPHFEKMLYDQAQLAWAYLEGYQLTGRREYAETARGIFNDVARDLTSTDGAFAAAEDADSEGEEGRFYVWTPDQLAAALPPGQSAIMAYRYGVTRSGNFAHGASILHEAHTLEETASHAGTTIDSVGATLARARATLLEVRSRRPRPHRDDTIICAWNGLMISALARGARVLEDTVLLARAERAATFAWTRLRDAGTGEIHRRFLDGEAAGPGQLADYAFLALGFLDTYRASLDPVWLERSVAVTEAQEARFRDERDGGYFESPAGDPHLPVRMKDGSDGAEISGSSIAVANVLTLGALLDRREWRAHADRTLSSFAGRLEAHPTAMPQMLVAMEMASHAPRHIVIAGRRGAPDTRALLREFDRRYLPNDVLLLTEPGDATLARLVPFAAALPPRHGVATAYVCVNYACDLPVTDPAAFGAQLEAPAAARPRSREPR